MTLPRNLFLSLAIVGLVSTAIGADDKPATETKTVTRPFLNDLLRNLEKYRNGRVTALNVFLAGLTKNTSQLKEDEKAVDTLINQTNNELRTLTNNYETDLLVINLQRGAVAITFRDSNLDLHDEYRDVFPGEEDPNPDTREKRFNEYLQKKGELDNTRVKNLAQCRDMEILVTNEYLDSAQIIVDQHNRATAALDDKLLIRARALSGGESEDFKVFDGALAKVKTEKSTAEIQLAARDAAAPVKRRQPFETTLLTELAGWRKNLTTNQISELANWISPLRTQWAGTWYDCSQPDSAKLNSEIKNVLARKASGQISAGPQPDQVVFAGVVMSGIEFQIEKNGKKRPLPEEFKDEAQLVWLWRIGISSASQKLPDLRKFAFADGKTGEVETQLMLADDKPIDSNSEPELASKARVLVEAIETGNVRRFFLLRNKWNVQPLSDWSLKVDGKILVPVFFRNTGTAEVPKLVSWKSDNFSADVFLRNRWNKQMSDLYWESRIPPWLKEKLKTLKK